MMAFEDRMGYVVILFVLYMFCCCLLGGAIDRLGR